MADFSALKTSIQNYIKQNGNEEIKGNLLQQILLSMVSTLGDSAINDLVTDLNAEIANRGNADTELGGNITTLQGVVNGIKANVENGYVYAGIATPSTTPASGKVFYLALTAGKYTNFGATVVPQGINILKYNGSAWSLDSFLGLDNAPTQGSGHLVKSGGVLDSIIKDGSAFDLSAYNNGTTYADLSAALTALNALPAAYKKGGMSFKYVQTSDNNYVQFRCISDSFTTDVTKWQREYTEEVNVLPLFSASNEIIVDSTEYEQGTIQSGGEDGTSNIRVRSNYIPFTTKGKCYIKIIDGFKVNIHFFTSEKVWISNGWINGAFYSPKNVAYIRVVIGKTSDANLTPSDIPTDSLMFYNDIKSSYFDNINYKTCSTGATTAAKTITTDSDFLNIVGYRFLVKFTNANERNNVTLNINNLGAYPLYINGNQADSGNSWKDGDTFVVYFDGEKYIASPFGYAVDENPSSLSKGLIRNDGMSKLVKSIINGNSNNLNYIFVNLALDGDSEVTNAKRLLCGFSHTDYPIAVTIPPGYACNVLFFDNTLHRTYHDTGWKTEDFLFDCTIDPYFRVLLKKTDDSNMSPSDADSFIFSQIIKIQELEAFKNEVGVCIENDDEIVDVETNWEQGSISSSGADAEGVGGNPNPARIRTGYILNPYNVPKLLKLYAYDDCEITVYGYDYTKAFIGSYLSVWGESTSKFVGKFAYIRIALRKKSGANISPSAFPVSIRFYASEYYGNVNNGIIYPSYNYFDYETRKLTHNSMYSAWCQDKCFMHNGVMYVFYNEGTGHGVGLKVMLIKSYDFGHTFTEPEIFYENGSNVSSWGAGEDENGIYMFIRNRTGGYVTGGTQWIFYYLLDGESEWVSKIVDFDDGAGNQPVELCSFAKLPDNSIAFGYFYTKTVDGNMVYYNNGIVKSSDLFDTYTKHQIISDDNFADPMLCVVGNTVYGTVRSQSNSVPAKFFVSTDSCETFNLYNMPVWNATDILPLRYVNGKIVSFSTARTLGNCRILYYEIDEKKLRMLTSGDVPDFNVYNIGHVTQYNQGASGCGVASGIVVGNWIYWFYGSENSYNLMPDIYMTKMFIEPAKDYTEPLNVYITN